MKTISTLATGCTQALVLPIALLLASSLIPATATAENIFVARGPTASDENPGTSALPLKTVAEAIWRAEPGDAVIVRPGNYRNEDSGWGRGVIPVVNKSGTGEAPIRVIGVKGPLIGSFLILQSSHVRISGFRVFGSRFYQQENWEMMPAIVRDIELDQQMPIDFAGPWEDRREFTQAAFSTYFSIIDGLNFSSGIDIESSSHIAITRNLVIGFWSGIQCRGASNIHISWNRISNCVNGIFTFDPAPGLTDSWIVYNSVSQSLDTGIFIRRGSDRVRVSQNFVRFSGINHISLAEGTTNSLVSFNNVRFGGYYSETMRFPGSSAISLNDCGDGNDLLGNVALNQIDLTGIDGNGMILDLMREGTTTKIRWNFVGYNMGSGLNLTISPNSRIWRNAFLKNGFSSTTRRNGAGIKLSRDQDTGNTITRNSFLWNREAGILSSDTLLMQRLVDRNFYLTKLPSALAWDAFEDDVSNYKTLEELQLNTDWEVNGKAIVRD